MPLRGSYYDGASSARHEVTLWRDGACLCIAGAGIERSCAIAQLRVSPPLGRLRRTLTFPDGALCEVEESAALDTLLGLAGPGRTTAGLIHRWEKSFPLALGALALTVLLVWGFLRFSIPGLAHHLASAVPAASEAAMGDETLDFLDNFILQPTALSKERQEEVRQLFADLCRNLPAAGYRLELRASKALGANALALPGGIVVATDDFISLAANNEQIIAVLAHECAHIRKRHALRQLLQNSAVGVVIASLTGDITSVTALAAGLPTALVNARYSRDFEAEADADAVAYLRAQAIPASHYADILRRLQAYHDKKSGGSGKEGGTFGDLFSTHPETEERIRQVLAAGA